MILSSTELVTILKNKTYNKQVFAGKQANKLLQMHLSGIGLNEYIEQVIGFENQQKVAVRKKYARSNKDIFARLLRPIDNIYSAKGSTAYYNLPESKLPQFKEQLNSVEWGYSLRKWMQLFYMPQYCKDPMGLIFIEVGNNEAYPTYKSIQTVVDYKTNGRRLEYVIFKTDNPDVYRVVDDSFDAFYKFDGEQVTVQSNETYPNYFGYVPARIISNIPSSVFQDIWISPIDDVVELANDYLIDCSVKTVYKKLHGFPKYWQYEQPCKACHGTGFIAGDTCTSCNGSQYESNPDVSDTLQVRLPSTGEIKIAPDLAGYVTPDIEGWDKLDNELKSLEQAMCETIWGTHEKDHQKNETATGRFIDTQPVNNRLSAFADASEEMEQFITDAIGQFMFVNEYKGSSIHYSRRFLIETPDQIWEKYNKARKDGSPISLLDDLLIDYYHTRYGTDSIQLGKQVKLMKVEPMVHNTLQEAKGLAPDTEYNMKLYFGEWVKTLSEMEIINTPIATLTENLKKYTQSKTPFTKEPVIE